MDYTSILSVIISSVLGGGIVGTVLFYQQNKRAKELDNKQKSLANDDVAIDQWKDLYFETEKKSQAKSKKIEELTEELNKEKAKSAKLYAQKERLVELKCVHIGCDKRKPPLGTAKDCDTCTSECDKVEKSKQAKGES